MGEYLNVQIWRQTWGGTQPLDGVKSRYSQAMTQSSFRVVLVFDFGSHLTIKDSDSPLPLQSMSAVFISILDSSWLSPFLWMEG